VDIIEIAALTVVMLLCAFLQASSGFGFALVAMPLVTLTLGLNQAGPVVAAAALLLYVANTARLRRHVNWPEWLRLAAATVVGVPLGFWAHAHVPEGWIRGLLAVLLIGYAVYGLVRLSRLPAISRKWVYLAGLSAGTLAGAFNMPGPPVVVYGNLRAWPRDQFRSTLQAFFLVNGLLVVGGHALLGHYDRHSGSLVLASVPALVLGNLAGRLSDRHLNHERFQVLVLLLIGATGAALLL
jgi:hypothetical protein